MLNPPRDDDQEKIRRIIKAVGEIFKRSISFGIGRVRHSASFTFIVISLQTIYKDDIKYLNSMNDILLI